MRWKFGGLVRLRMKEVPVGVGAWGWYWSVGLSIVRFDVVEEGML